MPAQTVVEHTFATPLPLGTFVSAPSPVFHGADAVALAGNGELHWITGLPDAPVQQWMALTGPLQVSGSWAKLSDTVGSYASTAGELILVRGLPHAPTVTATGLNHPPAEWVPVSATTAVAVDVAGQQFHVLRHGQGAATITVVPSFAPLSDGAYEWGRVDDDGLLGLGAGWDATSGTLDDELVLLTGLSQPSGGELVSVTAMPVGFVPRGFVVTTTGVGALWQDLEYIPGPTVELALARWSSFLGLQIDLFTVHPGIGLGGPLPGTPWGGVRPGLGDDLIVRVRDDVAVEDVLTMVKSVSTAPNVAGSVAGAWPIAECELANSGVFGGPLVQVTSFATQSPRTASLQTVGDLLHVVRPGPSNLVVFGQGPLGESFVTLVDDVFGSPHARHTALMGTLGSTYTTPPIALGPGRILWFTADFSGPTPVTGVGIMTVSVNVLVGPARPWDNWLTAWPALPTIADALTLQATTYPGPADVLVFVSTALLPTPLNVSSIVNPVEIDPALMFPPLLLPDGGSLLSEVTLPLATLPPVLRGMPLYLQAARSAYGGFELSQPLMLIIG